MAVCSNNAATAYAGKQTSVVEKSDIDTFDAVCVNAF